MMIACMTRSRRTRRMGGGGATAGRECEGAVDGTVGWIASPVHLGSGRVDWRHHVRAGPNTAALPKSTAAGSGDDSSGNSRQRQRASSPDQYGRDSSTYSTSDTPTSILL